MKELEIFFIATGVILIVLGLSIGVGMTLTGRFIPIAGLSGLEGGIGGILILLGILFISVVFFKRREY